MSGKKETEGKLDYELDWEFIETMAKKMAMNKGKYEPYNWKKGMNVEKLKQAMFRHVIEVMKGNYDDDVMGHLESIALNAMFINYQIKNKSNDVYTDNVFSLCDCMHNSLCTCREHTDRQKD